MKIVFVYFNGKKCSWPELYIRNVRKYCDLRNIEIGFIEMDREKLWKTGQVGGDADLYWLIEPNVVKKWGNQKVIFHAHGAASFTIDDYFMEEDKWFIDEKRAFEKADVVLLNSNTAKRAAEEYYGIEDLYNSEVIGFPIDFDEFDGYEAVEKKNKIAIVGRLDYDKAPFPYLRDLKMLKDVGYEILFITAECSNNMKLMLERAGFEVFFGVDKSEYYKKLAEAKYVFVGVRSDSLNVSVVEAAYLGVIPVLPNTELFKELYPKNVYEYLNFESVCEGLKNFKKIDRGLLKGRFSYEKVFDRIGLPV